MLVWSLIQLPIHVLLWQLQLIHSADSLHPALKSWKSQLCLNILHLVQSGRISVALCEVEHIFPLRLYTHRTFYVAKLNPSQISHQTTILYKKEK